MAMRPMTSVTAKPLIGPVPNWKRKAAAMSAVAWVSRIVIQTRSKPLLTAARTVLPLRSSSRMRSKTSTLVSTPTPMVRMMPAMPGRVRVAPK